MTDSEGWPPDQVDEALARRRYRRQIEELKAMYGELRAPMGDPIEQSVAKLVDLSPERFEKEAARLKLAAKALGAPPSINPYDRILEVATARREGENSGV